MAQPVEAIYGRRIGGAEEDRQRVCEMLACPYFQWWTRSDDSDPPGTKAQVSNS